MPTRKPITKTQQDNEEEVFTPQPLKALVPAREVVVGEVVSWGEQLAQEAETLAQMERASGGTFFGTKGGVLAWQNEPITNNEMVVIVIDSMFENSWRENKIYDADNPTNPDCYALSYVEEDMAPHDVVVQAGMAQHATCKGCPKNGWGTADQGKGKACRNGRRLATIPGGQIRRDGTIEYYRDAEDFEDTMIGYLKLPPTSVRNKRFKSYSTVAKELAEIHRRPLWSVYTKIKIVPDIKDQFHIVFEPLGAVPDDLLPVLKQRASDAKLTTGFPYALNPKVEKSYGATEAETRNAATQPARKRKY